MQARLEAKSEPVRPLWEPIPLMELPYLVPEIRDDVERLRAVLYRVLRSRRELLDRLKDVTTVPQMTRVIWEIYDEASSQEALEELAQRRWPPPAQRTLDVPSEFARDEI